MASYLVTGSTRGIGYTLASLLAAKPATEVSKIFASGRTETSNVKELIAKSGGRVEFIPLDVTSEASAKKAAALVEESLAGKGLDVLINNAGVMDSVFNPIEQMSGSELDNIFKINVTGVHYVTSAFLPLLQKGSLKKVANISTTLGSIELAPKYRMMPLHGYKISKAALNMLTVQYALAFEEQGFSFFAISPGWLKTDLGGSNADLPVEVGATQVIDIIERATKEQNGKFLNIHVPGWEKAEGPNQYDGAGVPW